MLGVYIKVLTAYLVVKILDFKFIISYIKVFYFLSVTSIVFYIISNLQINILTPISINTSSIESLYPRYSVYGLFTYIPRSIIRNSGQFWEPGAFAGYLMLAFIFNFFSYLKNKKKIGMVLLIAILTTMSTTAYLSIFVFSLFTFYKKINSIIIKFIAVCIMIFGGYYSSTKIDFLGEKIVAQMSVLNEDVDLESSDSARFLSLLKDIKDFDGHEIIGRGFNSETRFFYDRPNQIRTVGLTDIMVKLGLPFFIIIMLMLYHSLSSLLNFNNYNKKIFVVSSFSSILILLMSQLYFNYPLFWCLLFLKFVYPKKKRTT